jgi:hypothetical protein
MNNTDLIARLKQTNQFSPNADVTTAEVVAALEAVQPAGEPVGLPLGLLSSDVVRPLLAEGEMMTRGYSAIGLHQPKTPVNVGAALRAAGCYGAAMVATSGITQK